MVLCVGWVVSSQTEQNQADPVMVRFFVLSLNRVGFVLEDIADFP